MVEEVKDIWQLCAIGGVELKVSFDNVRRWLTWD